jgi:transcriptional regulator with XRE-family HTH domain
MSFGRRLKQLREAAGLTQQQLADRSNTPKASIANLEQDRYKATWENVLKLAAALGVDCRAFVENGAGSAKPKAAKRGRPQNSKEV